MQSIGNLKRGDTFAFVAQLTGADGEPLVGAVSKLRSQVRTSRDALLLELEVSEYVDPATGMVVDGSYVFKSAVATDTLPLGHHLFDIQFTDGTTVTSTETVELNVVGDVTRA